MKGMVATMRGEPFVESGQDVESIMQAVAKKPQAVAVQGYTKLF